MKLLFLGLDGLEPSDVEKWSDELPFLSRFLKEGFFSWAYSEVPYTHTAWPAIMAGYWPDYTDEYKLSPIRGTARIPLKHENDVLWRILSKKYKTGVWDVPIFAPADNRVNGFMVTGNALTPFSKYPHDLPVKPLRHTWDKSLRPERFVADGKFVDGALEDLRALAEERFVEEVKRQDKLLHMLLNTTTEVPVDVLLFYSWLPDVAYHRCWCYDDITLRVLKYVDKVCTTLEQVYSPEYIAICSDHGACEVEHDWWWYKPWTTYDVEGKKVGHGVGTNFQMALHGDYGVFGLLGPGIPQQHNSCNLNDVAPTLLSLLDIKPVPWHEGIVLPIHGKELRELSKEEERLMEGMGYIGGDGVKD